MSEHALKLIAENKKTKEPFLDLGNCGMDNYLPKELGDCIWLKSLNLGVIYFNESNKWIETKNGWTPNHFQGDELFFLEKLTGLQSLNLSFNQISDISFLEKLTGLQSLDLSNNQISDTRFLKKLTGIQSLYLSDNQISDIRFLEKLTSLQSLDLSDNQISDISFLEKLTGLQSLYLSDNQISDISFLEKLTGLQSLYFRSNQISDLSFLENLICLHSLDLRNNQISDIRFLEKLTSLQSLDLSNNQISDIRFLEKLTGLQSLVLSYNKINDIRFLEKLTGLQSLDLSSNQIIDPSFLEKMTSLQSLDLSDNQISHYSFLEKLKSLQSLDLSFNQINDYSFLEKLTGLQSLDLSNNKISDISFLENLTSLQSLDLSENQIYDIRFLEKLTGLQTLDLRENKINDYSFLENLTGVQSLDFRENKINDYSFLENLTGVQSLDLSENQISDIRFLEKLTGLLYLYLNDNQISDIRFLEKLTSLQSLDLSYNKIYDIKDLKKICLIQSITDINVENNLLPLHEGLDLSDVEELRAYFKDAELGVSNQRSIKLMFIGDGCAGKSTLYQHLKLGIVPPNIDINDRTHGIALDIWQGAIQDVDIRVWDFGGQDIFHSTHRLFLGQRAVYVLVWTKQANKKCTEGEQHPLRYWLDFIADYGKNSTVILVENIIDGQFDSSEFPDDVSLEQLVEEYGNKGIRLDTTHHRIDCKHDTQKVKRFKTILQSEIEQLLEDFPVKDFPANWHTVQEALEKQQVGNKTIRWSDYKAICQKVNISNAQALLNFLDRSGVVSYYPNLFQNKIILQTDWILDAMYSFLKLKDNQFLRLEGKLTDEDFINVWQEKYSADEQELFKSFMLKSEIMANHQHNYHNKIERAYQYLIPALFKECKPHQKVKWDSEEHYLALKFKFVYNAIMQRLQVRVLTYCHVNEEESFYRNRISFTDKHGKVAHIELLEDEKELRISAEQEGLYNDILKEINGIYPLDRLKIIERQKGKEEKEIYYNDKEISKSGFDKISIKEVNTIEPMSIETIKIFVTYCWTDKEETFDDEHQNKVRTFVDALSDYQDFDATFDLYENQASTATNFIRMMYENITKSKKVIIVLSEGYQLKANDFKGGVGIEYEGIMNDIKYHPRKYILVTFDNRSNEIYPFGLQGRDTVWIKNGDLESTENEDNKNILFSKLKDEAIYVRPTGGSKTAVIKKK